MRKIKVENKHIQEAIAWVKGFNNGDLKGNRACECVIARAIKESLNNEYKVSCSPSSALIFNPKSSIDYNVELPFSARLAIRNFDEGLYNRLDPFEFEIDFKA